MEIESEKRELNNQAKELREYNNLLNSHLKINRDRFLLLSEFLEESIEDVKYMDEIICTLDKSPNKLLLFSNIDLDSLSYKRKNYKNDMDGFRKFFKDSSIYEKELYDKILIYVLINKINFSKMNKKKNLKMIIILEWTKKKL
jgi:ferritin